MTAWLIAKAIPWLLGFMALFGLYQRGVHNGKVKAHRDTLDAPLRRCAGALAGDDMPAARRDCLPVVAIYQAATGR